MSRRYLDEIRPQYVDGGLWDTVTGWLTSSKPKPKSKKVVKHRAKPNSVTTARTLTNQTKAIKVGYNGGTQEQVRRRYWQEEPVMRHAVDSIAGRYGINPMLLANRLEHEGFVDHQVQDRNKLIKRKQPQGIARGYEILNDAPGRGTAFKSFGLDDSATYIDNGTVRLINERWSAEDNRQEGGRKVRTANGETIADNIGIQAATLKAFREQAARDFPNATSSQLDSYAAAYYNRGPAGGRKFVKSGGKDNRYNIRTTYAQGGRVYNIKRGDTLSKIAAANNLSIEDILALNAAIKNPDMIYAGSQINLPGEVQEVAVTPTSTQEPSAIPAWLDQYMPQPLENGVSLRDMLTVFGAIPRYKQSTKKTLAESTPADTTQLRRINSRSDYWKSDPVMSAAVDSIANEYGIPGRVLKERLNREGFVDHMIENVNTRLAQPKAILDYEPTTGYNTLNRQEYENEGPAWYGTDWAGAMLKKGAISLKGEKHYNHPFINEVGQTTDALSSNTVAGNIGIMAAMLKYFRDAAKRDHPRAKGKTLDDYTMIYYNRGEPGARKYINSGQYKGHYNM